MEMEARVLPQISKNKQKIKVHENYQEEEDMLTERTTHKLPIIAVL